MRPWTATLLLVVAADMVGRQGEPAEVIPTRQTPAAVTAARWPAAHDDDADPDRGEDDD